MKVVWDILFWLVTVSLFLFSCFALFVIITVLFDWLRRILTNPKKELDKAKKDKVETVVTIIIVIVVVMGIYVKIFAS